MPLSIKAQADAEAANERAAAVRPTGLQLLREPFPANLVSKLPKETKTQREERERDKSKMVWRCAECGGAHHAKAVHLDYVGHAALTTRLLDADPAWHWEPAAWTPEGLPRFDATGGLWIKLVVCGVHRLGYGHAAAKPNQDPGSREKEVIGDALRNAAMRFGAALDLWHKGDLHAHEGPAHEGEEAAPFSGDRARPAMPQETPALEENGGRAGSPSYQEAKSRGPAEDPRPATISANAARKNGDWGRVMDGAALQRTPEELGAYINHPDQKAIWTRWPDHWKAEMREDVLKLKELLVERLAREAADRELDREYDPRTGEVFEDRPRGRPLPNGVPFDDEIPF